MKVYISGKITGTDDYMERFAKAEKEIKAAGDVAVNPVGIVAGIPGRLSHNQCMSICLTLLDSCECMYVLKDWKGSRGVKMEIEHAKRIKMPIFYEEDYEDFEELTENTIDVNLLDKGNNLKSACEQLEDMAAELKEYRKTGISAKDLKIIDETYKDMARRLVTAEKRLDEALDKLSEIRDMCGGYGKSKGGAA